MSISYAKQISNDLENPTNIYTRISSCLPLGIYTVYTCIHLSPGSPTPPLNPTFRIPVYLCTNTKILKEKPRLYILTLDHLRVFQARRYLYLFFR